MKTKYGIISDIHRTDPRVFELAVKILKDEGINGLVLNGDINGDQRQDIDSRKYFAYVLMTAGNSGLETYVLPGSHEDVMELEPVMEVAKSKFSNLIYVIENPRIEKTDHDLVFLAGSDWRPTSTVNSGFAWDTEHESGIYRTNDGVLRIINMNDLRNYVKKPERTVLFTHVPRKFDTLDGVDMAHFLEILNVNYKLEALRNIRKELFISIQAVTPAVPDLIDRIKETKLPYLEFKDKDPSEDEIVEAGRKFAKKNNLDEVEVYVERRENRGNNDLKEILDELGIKKHVTGHFHESVHRAHNSKNEGVKQGEFTDDLYWMASYLDRLKVGILTVRDNKVAYENVDLSEYVKR